MASVADFAGEFARRAEAGKRPTVRVRKGYAEAFLGELARLGIAVARECLDQIRDPELRRIVETIFFSTAAGAALGAAAGALLAGPAGAKVGAVVGAGAGLVAGCMAVVLTLRQEDGPSGPELVVSVQ